MRERIVNDPNSFFFYNFFKENMTQKVKGKKIAIDAIIKERIANDPIFSNSCHSNNSQLIIYIVVSLFYILG